MISEELKEEIISMWKKEINISQISREKKVSRQTVRKIIDEYKKIRKWYLIRANREKDFVRIVVRAPYSYSSIKDSGPIERLALGVEMYAVRDLIHSIVKPETAEEIMYNFVRVPPGVCVLYVRESELNSKFRNIDRT